MGHFPTICNEGGVQECLYMGEKNVETVYLQKRFGFVRLALLHGAPMVSWLLKKVRV
jgi:hypothetical protein